MTNGKLKLLAFTIGVAAGVFLFFYLFNMLVSNFKQERSPSRAELLSIAKEAEFCEKTILNNISDGSLDEFRELYISKCYIGSVCDTDSIDGFIKHEEDRRKYSIEKGFQYSAVYVYPVNDRISMIVPIYKKQDKLYESHNSYLWLKIGSKWYYSGLSYDNFIYSRDLLTNAQSFYMRQCKDNDAGNYIIEGIRKNWHHLNRY